jgi:hypothetical protein
VTTPSQVPVRYPSGVTSDYPWGPLANSGAGNPFFYQVLQDDFMGAVSGNENWQAVTSGTGATVTEVAGDGGQWLLTTSSSGAGTAGILGNKGNFVIPPAASTGTGLAATRFSSKKLFYLARINVTVVASTTIYAGLMPSTTTTSLPTDGLFFVFTNATTVALKAYSGSTNTWSVSIPAAVLTASYTNATWIDVGFYMDRLMNVYVFFGFPLVGWVPASAWTGVNNTTAAPPPLGAVAAYQVSTSGAWTPSTATTLTPGVIADATAETVYVDFMMASKER